MKTKKCSSCEEIKDISLFSKDCTTKTGFSARCKECSSNISKKYYNKNKEAQKEKKRNTEKK